MGLTKSSPECKDILQEVNRGETSAWHTLRIHYQLRSERKCPPRLVIHGLLVD